MSLLSLILVFIILTSLTYLPISSSLSIPLSKTNVTIPLKKSEGISVGKIVKLFSENQSSNGTTTESQNILIELHNSTLIPTTRKPTTTVVPTLKYVAKSYKAPSYTKLTTEAPRNLTEAEENQKMIEEVLLYLAARVRPQSPGTIFPVIRLNNTDIPIECANDDECNMVPHSNCVKAGDKSKCQCLVNFRMQDPSDQDTLFHCESATCTKNEECHDWDPKMVCATELHTCTCPEDYKYSRSDHKCISMGGGFSWLLAASIAVPIIAVIIFCISCCRLAKTTLRLGS